MIGSIRKDQDIIGCPRCERMMHTDCVKDIGVSIEGNHVRHAVNKMRGIVDRLGLRSSMVPFCAGCGEVIIDDIVATYRESGNIEDGAKFLEEMGRYSEAKRFRSMSKPKESSGTQVTVDLNRLIDQLQSGKLAIPYSCPGCGASIGIDQSSTVDGLKVCQYCESTLNTDAIIRLLEKALDN
jgi:hypothetical protein